MSEAYEGKRIVGMELHRRRSVLVRMTETGEPLETVRISNDPEYLSLRLNLGSGVRSFLGDQFGGFGGDLTHLVDEGA